MPLTLLKTLLIEFSGAVKTQKTVSVQIREIFVKRPLKGIGICAVLMVAFQ